MGLIEDQCCNRRRLSAEAKPFADGEYEHIAICEYSLVKNERSTLSGDDEIIWSVQEGFWTLLFSTNKR